MKPESVPKPALLALEALARCPVRVALLQALSQGQALPAGELAWRASVSLPVARGHLAALLADGVVAPVQTGRHVYYIVASPLIARLVEQALAIAPPARIRDRRDRRQVAPLRTGRTCYGHLAGVLGVSLVGGLCASGLLRLDGADYHVTRDGQAWFADLGLDLPALRQKRRSFARRCIDWSERVPHLGGALGDALATRLFELDWVRRTPPDRAVRLTEKGRRQLRASLDVHL